MCIRDRPKTMRITSDDITEAIDEPLQQLIESIHGVLEHTPAELAADIFEYGILLSGGGAEMFGLCEADVYKRQDRMHCTY